MDGTLLDLHFDNRFWLHYVPKCYGERHGLDLETARSQLLPMMQAVRGTLDWYDVHYWSSTLDMDILSLKTDLAHLIRARPGAMDFLFFLRSRNKAVWLATNAHIDTISLKFSRSNLGPLFDLVVSSSELGAPKESLDFWSRLAERHPVDPETTLFIDDGEPILEVARDFGIRFLYTIDQPDLLAPPRAEHSSAFPTLKHFNDLTN